MPCTDNDCSCAIVEFVIIISCSTAITNPQYSAQQLHSKVTLLYMVPGQCRAENVQLTIQTLNYIHQTLRWNKFHYNFSPVTVLSLPSSSNSFDCTWGLEGSGSRGFGGVGSALDGISLGGLVGGGSGGWASIGSGGVDGGLGVGLAGGLGVGLSVIGSPSRCILSLSSFLHSAALSFSRFFSLVMK